MDTSCLIDVNTWMIGWTVLLVPIGWLHILMIFLLPLALLETWREKHPYFFESWPKLDPQHLHCKWNASGLSQRVADTLTRTVARDFWSLLFMTQHLIGPWWMSRNSFSRICGDIYARSLTFRRLFAESQNFLWNIPWKGMPFRGMSKLP
jgi:hypothetical protein